MAFCKKKDTAKRYKKKERTLKVLKDFLPKNKLLKTINSGTIEDFKLFRKNYSLEKKFSENVTMSNVTISSDVADLHHFFEYCRKRSYFIGNNPAKGQRYPKEKRIVKLTDENIKEMFEKADEQTQIILNIGLFSGLRRKEMCGLEWIHVDFENKKLKLPKEITKGGEKARNVVIPDCLINELKKWQLKNVDSKYVLSFPWKDRIEAFTFFWKNFSRSLSFRMQDGKPIRSHDLRHKCGQDSVQNGIHPVIVQQQLGHGDLSTTMFYYVNDEFEVDQAEITKALSKKKAG